MPKEWGPQGSFRTGPGFSFKAHLPVSSLVALPEPLDFKTQGLSGDVSQRQHLPPHCLLLLG